MSPLVLILMVGVLILMAAALVAAGIQATRQSVAADMEGRLERFGHIRETSETPAEERDTRLFMAQQVERAVKGHSFSDKTRTQLAQADLRMTVGEWILVRIGSTAFGFLLGMFMGRSALALALLFGVLVAFGGWMAPQLYLSMRAKRRQKAFVNQLGDTIGLMANSLRAGYSLLQTMELIGRESPAPMSIEFRRVVREVGLGISTHQALDNLYRRVPSEDLDLFITAIKIQSEVGGNLGQILDVIGETIRERVRIHGEIRTLTAQQSMSGYVISGLPVALGGILFMLNGEYMTGMFVWPWICLPIGAVFLEIAGFLVMRKIVAIEV